MADFLGQVFPKAAVKAASTVPAYALVFIDLLIVVLAATQTSLTVAIVVDVSVVVLSVYVIWIVELRSRSVATASPAQAERLAEVRDLAKPISCVFESLVGDDDVYVVHSSTQVAEFVDQRGVTVQPDKNPAYGGAPERRVTTIPDAVGAARIYNLLYLGGKRERLRSITSWPDDFRKENWDASLILLGSGRSNRITTEVLADFECPYTFTDDFDSIMDTTSPGERWPSRSEELATQDYGIVVKFRVERSERCHVYMVIAGVGPYGTLAGCRFLESQIQTIYNTYADSPFAYILSVKRDSLSYFEPKVERHRALPIVRR
jgi:hypothetical protein